MVSWLISREAQSPLFGIIEHRLQCPLDRHIRLVEGKGNRIWTAAQTFDTDEFDTVQADRREDRAQLRRQEIGLARRLVTAIPTMGADHDDRSVPQ